MYITFISLCSAEVASAESRVWWIPLAHGVLKAIGRTDEIESAEDRRWWLPIAQGILDAYKLKQAKGRADEASDDNEEENFMDIEPIKDMKELKEAISEIQKMESKGGKKAESRRWWIPIAQGVLTALGRSADVDKIVDVAENRENNMLAIQPIHNKKELDAALKLIQKMESNQDRSLAESRRWWIPIAQGVLSALGRSGEIDELAEERRWWLPIAQGILDAYKLKQAKGRTEDDEEDNMDVESAEERWWKPIAHTFINLLGRAGDAAEENEEENFMDIEPIKDIKELKEAIKEIQKMDGKNGKKAESRRWWIPIAQGVLTALGRSAEVDEIINVAENREDNMLAIQPIHNKKELDAALKLIQKMESNQDRSFAESRRWWIPIAKGVLTAIGRSEEIDEPAEERRWWLPIAQGLLDAYKLKSAKGRAVDDAEDNEEENFMDIEPIKDMNELKEAVSEIQKMESKNGKKAESRRWWIPIAQGVLTALG